MNIEILTVTDVNTNKIIWAEGIEESNVSVQVILPKSIFTESEINKIKNDETIFDSIIFDNDSDHVNLGNHKSFILDNMFFENFKIEIITKNIELNDFIFKKMNLDDYENVACALVVTNNETKELLFAEGTEIDGYDYHQVTIPLSKISKETLDKLCENFFNHKIYNGTDNNEDYIWLGDMEAKDYGFDCNEITIKKVYFSVNS